MKNILFLVIFVMLAFSKSAVADVASVSYVAKIINALDEQISTKASNDDVVHNTGNETIAGIKTFSDNIVLTTQLEDAVNDNTVPTTLWTNQRIDAAKGQVPVGSANSDTFVNMWMEE